MASTESPPPLFSSGSELADVAISSNILRLPLDAIAEAQALIASPTAGQHSFSSSSSASLEFKVVEHPNYKILAFATSPPVIPVSDLHKHRELVHSNSSEMQDFGFLPSSFSVDKAAISLFRAYTHKLSPLKSQVMLDSTEKENAASATSANAIPYIITGHHLGGSVASLFTLWLLDGLCPANSKLPLCITFGSPLLGDGGLQQAISQYSTWNSCFLHVVHKDDCFPRLFLPPTTQPSPYKPFGTFLFCSEWGSTCFLASESLMELYACKSWQSSGNNQDSQPFDYSRVIKHLERRITYEDRSPLNGHDLDSYKAGMAAQFAIIGLLQTQSNGSNDAQLQKIIKFEEDVMRQKREEFDPGKELNKMKVYLAYMEWYKKVCEADGQGSGYYDSFKNKLAKRDHKAVEFKIRLNDYWKRVVEDTEKKPQRKDAPLRIRFLFGGMNYQRMVEPLDIAEYYKRGQKNYLTQGRCRHYKLLEKWMDEHQKKSAKRGPTSSKKKKSRVIITEDPCFWAHVEEAIISCRLLNSGASNSVEKENLIKFEHYVMGLVKNYAVSPDIFLDSSSYMQWWREYEEVLEKHMLGASRDSELKFFMRSYNYYKYAAGLLTFE